MTSLEKHTLSFVLGVIFVIILDLVWASKGYAQGGVWYVCQDPVTGMTNRYEGGCPPGWIFIDIEVW